MIERKKIVAEVLLNELHRLGVEYVFLVPGAQIIPIVFKLYEKQKNIPHPIIANHELAAGYMAIGYAKASGKIGVAFSIGGPGAAYMIGAGVTAKTDDVSVLFITGNIPIDHFGKGEFQDASKRGTNDSGVFNEAIGNSFICDDIIKFKDVLSLVHQCDAETKPFHIQIPISIQGSEYAIQYEKTVLNNSVFKATTSEAQYLETKTLLFLGGGTLKGIDLKKLLIFVRKHKIPVVTDMKTRGLIPENDIESFGYVGFNSDLRALEVFDTKSTQKADVVTSFGVKNYLIDQYIDRTLIKVETINFNEINAWIDSVISKPQQIETRHNWLKQVNQVRSVYRSNITFPGKISYTELFGILKEEVPENTIFCLDAGQVRRAGSIFISCHAPRSLIQSETLSPMGLGICSSVGAQLANLKKHVVCLVGDGSMRMHGMELATAVRYKLPIIFVLCDNQSYASVKAQDEAKKLSKIDWSSFAVMIGIKSYKANNKMEFAMTLKESLHTNEPVLIWTLVPDLLDDELKKAKTLEYDNWLSDI